MNKLKLERCHIGDREELFLRNRAKATGPLNVYDRQFMLDAARVICELQDMVSRAPLPDNKAVDMVFGHGELGVATVAANEDAPLREVLIYRQPSPVLPIGSSLGDEGKSVEELENVLVRMHFKNAESAHVLERAVRLVLDSFEEPDNKALTGEELREMTGQPVWIVEYPDWGHWELAEYTEDYFEGRDVDFYGMTMPPTMPDPMGRYGLHMMGWLAYRRPPDKGE